MMSTSINKLHHFTSNIFFFFFYFFSTGMTASATEAAFQLYPDIHTQYFPETTVADATAGHQIWDLSITRQMP